jgi:2-amino-4-hydroxy-6-hydroxymethyldihydropteridine diphosphokinase
LPPLILIGLGANLDHPVWGTPRDTLVAALSALADDGVASLTRSGWYRSAPVPASEQPWYTNAVAIVATDLESRRLLALMQRIEGRFGRVPAARNAARVVDLDLLDYGGQRLNSPELILPHPRMHERRFVLQPLAEIAPQWRHPILGMSARQLLAELYQDQRLQRMPC